MYYQYGLFLLQIQMLNNKACTDVISKGKISEPAGKMKSFNYHHQSLKIMTNYVKDDK